jgi:hypothetical protein
VRSRHSRVRTPLREAMSRTQYYCAASLDGYIAEADDRLDWLLNYEGSFEGDEVDPGPMAEGGSYERFLRGRRGTYQRLNHV